MSERFKPHIYGDIKFDNFYVECKICFNSITYESLIKINHSRPQPLMILYNNDLLRINFPGSKKCHHARTIPFYISTSYKMPKSEIFSSISYVKCTIEKKIKPQRVKVSYSPEIGCVFLTPLCNYVIYLSGVRQIIYPNPKYWHQVFGLDDGGAIGFFIDEHNNSIILDDLGQIVQFQTLRHVSQHYYSNGIYGIQINLHDNRFVISATFRREIPAGIYTKPALNAGD